MPIPWPRGPIPAPAPWEGGVDFITCFDEVTFDAQGVHFDLDGRAVIQGGDELDELAPNAGFFSTQGFAPSTRSDDAIVLSVDDDLANSLFFDIWRSDLAVAEDVANVRLDLPPVMMTSRAPGGDAGDPGVMSIGFGAMRFSTLFQEEIVRISASAIIPFTVEGGPDGVLMQGDPDPNNWDLRIEVTEWPESFGPDGLSVAQEVADREVTKQLKRKFVEGGLNSPLPTVELIDLAPDTYRRGDQLRFGASETVIDGPQSDHITVRGGLEFVPAGG